MYQDWNWWLRMGKVCLIIATCIFTIWRCYVYSTGDTWSIIPSIMAAIFVMFMLLIALTITAGASDPDANLAE
jgi:uncharacterized membrane protein